VVEKQGELYIILDVIRIFTQKEEEKQKPRTTIQESSGENYYVEPQAAAPIRSQGEDYLDSALGFIKESLGVLKRFNVSPVNEEWFRKQFAEWSSTRTETNIQLKNSSDADEYLTGFYSPNTGVFWDDEYAAAVKNILPNLPSNNIQVWNLGCGKGYETFSFACILKSRYPDGHIKIWAHDSDIMAISQAPNMVFDLDEVPEFCRSFMSKGRNGYSFNQVIKDSIVFEYHDFLNETPLPELDIILARDILSFLSAEDQDKTSAGFAEKLKNRGLVLLGRNEQLSGDRWASLSKDPVSAFMRNE
jgi:purine-binding chemotaxis protein CheW